MKNDSSDSDSSFSEDISSSEDERKVIVRGGKEVDEKNKKKKKGKSKTESEEEEKLLYEDEPFLIFPPPPQPAASKRRGTGYINANLPQPPFMVLVVGPRKTGKSATIYNLLSKRRGSFGKAFIRQNIILYSPTMAFDKTLESLHLKWTYGPPTTVDSIIAHCKSEQNVFKQTNSMADILLVLEDVTNIPEVWNTLKDLGFTGRHFGFNTLAVAHKMSSINRGVRTQTQQWMLFKPHEESEVEWVLYTFARRKTRDIFEAAFTRAWSQKYNFIYIDFERDGGIENIYRSGFNDPLFTPEEISALMNIRLYRPDGKIAVEGKEEDIPLSEPKEERRAGEKRKFTPKVEEKRPTKKRKK